MTNILKCIANIKANSETNFDKIYPPKSEIKDYNRINNVGIALEYYIKDAFCNSFGMAKKDEIFNKNFSYLGNKNNPPDLIIKNSEAVEVKKLSSIDTTDIQLNSSYPKSKLQSDSSLITKDCRNCEPGWKEKDMIYAVGIVESNNLKQLTMIYGDCYAADAEVYERVKKRVTKGLYDTNLEFSETKELGRINRIDPLGITKLRIRGMWLITNPFKLYADMFNVNKLKNFTLLSVMSEEKYNSFPEKDKKVLEDDKEILIKNVKINNPNNPAKLLNAKLIEYTC